jgi:GntR family transcriptional regulator
VTPPDRSTASGADGKAGGRPELPLYYRVYKTLEQRIQERRVLPGERLPSEDELCREFRVSRMTIRQAVGRLVEAGLVTRRRGSGTYVGSPHEGPAFRAITFTGALEDLFAQVAEAQVKSARIAEETPPPDVREIMGLAEGEAVVVVRRDRAFDDDLFAVTVNYLPVRLGRRIDEAALYRTSLLQILEQGLGVRWSHADQTVEARAADEDTARALSVKFGDPVLYVQRLMYAGRPFPEELVRSHYRADVYRYQIRLERRRRARFQWPARPGDPAPAPGA